MPKEENKDIEEENDKKPQERKNGLENVNTGKTSEIKITSEQTSMGKLLQTLAIESPANESKLSTRRRSYKQLRRNALWNRKKAIKRLAQRIEQSKIEHTYKENCDGNVDNYIVKSSNIFERIEETKKGLENVTTGKTSEIKITSEQTSRGKLLPILAIKSPGKANRRLLRNQKRRKRAQRASRKNGCDKRSAKLTIDFLKRYFGNISERIGVKDDLCKASKLITMTSNAQILSKALTNVNSILEETKSDLTDPDLNKDIKTVKNIFINNPKRVESNDTFCRSFSNVTAVNSNISGLVGKSSETTTQESSAPAAISHLCDRFFSMIEDGNIGNLDNFLPKDSILDNLVRNENNNPYISLADCPQSTPSDNHESPNGFCSNEKKVAQNVLNSRSVWGLGYEEYLLSDSIGKIKNEFYDRFSENMCLNPYILERNYIMRRNMCKLLGGD